MLYVYALGRPWFPEAPSGVPQLSCPCLTAATSVSSHLTDNAEPLSAVQYCGVQYHHIRGIKNARIDNEAQEMKG